MRIVYSDHAKIKLTQRNIATSFVVATIQEPDFIKPTTLGRDQYFRKFTNLYLKVIAKKLERQVVVITAHWVAKTKAN